MCFSATASFVAGGVLMATGAAAIKVCQNKKHIPFASIPLLFGVQQVSEGFLWLALEKQQYSHWESNSTYFFLFFAQILWPFWVSFSIRLMELSPRIKQRLNFILWIGIIASTYLGYCLLNYNPKASISGYHIRYDLNFPFYFVWYSGLFYFIPTVIPTLISSIKNMKYLGLVILISFVISKLFYNEHLISIWCYFAAVLSSIVYLIIKRTQPATKAFS
jgi:hypothetical protein